MSPDGKRASTESEEGRGGCVRLCLQNDSLEIENEIVLVLENVI